MFKCHLRNSFVAIACASVVGCGASTPAEVVTSEIVLSSAADKADKLLNRAVEAGDYLATKAAIEALNTIDALEIVYERQLDRTVDDAHSLMRNVEEVEAVIEGGFDRLEDTTDSVRDLEVSLTQMVANTPLGEDGPYISHVSDFMLPPLRIRDHLVTLHGVDLHRLKFPDEYKDKINILRRTNTKITLQIDPDLFDGTSEELEIYTIPVKLYGDRWMGLGFRDTNQTELTFARLPQNYATYTYRGTYTKYVREEKPVERSATMEGKNTTLHKLVRPDQYWKIDLEKPIRFRQGDGISGSCKNDDKNARSENGIRLKARLDHHRTSLKYPAGRDGKQTCFVTFVQYRYVPIETEFSGTGEVVWNEDRQIILPSDTADVTIELASYDGRKTIIPGVSTVTDYIDVKREQASVILKPKSVREL